MKPIIFVCFVLFAACEKQNPVVNSGPVFDASGKWIASNPRLTVWLSISHLGTIITGSARLLDAAHTDTLLFAVVGAYDHPNFSLTFTSEQDPRKPKYVGKVCYNDHLVAISLVGWLRDYEQSELEFQFTKEAVSIKSN